MDAESSLLNQLLIAMPGMRDPNFSATVTLICEHDEEGALGIIINRPTTLSVGGLLEQLDLELPDKIQAETPVMAGGPVAPERGFVIHDAGDRYDTTVKVSDGIHLTMSRDVLDSLADGSGPVNSLVALGYAGWQPGQLENEILSNSWLNAPATPELLFNVPYERRWSAAAESVGIDLGKIGPGAGHA